MSPAPTPAIPPKPTSETAQKTEEKKLLQQMLLPQKGNPLIRDEDIVNYLQKKGNPLKKNILNTLEQPFNFLLLLDGWHCIAISVIFGLTLSLYNNCVFGKGSSSTLSLRLLKIPLFTASIYNMIEFGIANIAIFIVERMIINIENDSVAATTTFNDEFHNNNHNNGPKGPKLLPILLPCSLFSAVAIALSNASLKLLTLSHYTMVKSSSPIFMVTFSFIFGLEKLSLKLALIIVVIAVGVCLSVWNPSPHKVLFNITSSEWSLGVLLILSATCVAALRWTMTQILLKSPPSSISSTSTETAAQRITLLNQHIDASPTRKLSHLLFSLHLIRGMSSIVSCTLFFLSLWREGGLHLQSPFLTVGPLLWRAWLTVLVGGMQTFILLLLDYHVMREFSIGIMTLSVIGVGKEMTLISLSVLIFNDHLSKLNLLGLFVSIGGIIMYNIYKNSRAGGNRSNDVSLSYNRNSNISDNDDDGDHLNADPLSPLIIDKVKDDEMDGCSTGFNDILVE